jgi:predicted DNA-binding mobile mystery protein A
MKIDKKKQAIQRQIIERKIRRFAKLAEPIPPSGWIKAIRGSLGMTVKQLALRLGTSASSVSQLEEREPEKKVTIELMEKAARAMNCTFIYAIVPQTPFKKLEDIIDAKAREAASRLLKDVEHTMRLEAQGSSNEEAKKQIEKLAGDLKLKSDSRIWDIQVPTKKNADKGDFSRLLSFVKS